MLCYGCACCCCNNTRRGRNIKCTSPISTCATSIDRLCRYVLFQMYSNSFLPHNTRQASDFLHGFVTRSQVQSCQKSSHLCLGRDTRHDFFHHYGCLVFAQRGSSCYL